MRWCVERAAADLIYHEPRTACRKNDISEVWWLRVGGSWICEAHMCRRYLEKKRTLWETSWCVIHR